MDYQRWWLAEGVKEYRIVGVEQTIWPEGVKSEGKLLDFTATLDILVERITDGKRFVIDVKTSKAIYDAHIIQVSAIGEAVSSDGQMILQVGYKPNKCRYKLTDVPRRMDLYWLAWAICEREAEKAKDEPRQIDYPLSLSLGLPKKELPNVNEIDMNADPMEESRTAERENFEPEEMGEPMPDALRDAGPETETKQSRTKKAVKP
jgi:hypothetical protein